MERDFSFFLSMSFGVPVVYLNFFNEFLYIYVDFFPFTGLEVSAYPQIKMFSLILPKFFPNIRLRCFGLDDEDCIPTPAAQIVDTGGLSFSRRAEWILYYHATGPVSQTLLLAAVKDVFCEFHVVIVGA